MNQIELDFQKTKNTSVWRLVGVILFFVAMVLGLLLIIKNQQNIDETSKLLAEADLVKHPVINVIKSKDKAQDEALKNQLTEAVAVTKQLNLPWSSLFKALEDTLGQDINLLSVIPNAQTGEVLIVGHAESLSLVFAYIERLRKNKMLSKVRLNDHQKILQSGNQTIQFNIAAKWLRHHE